MSDEKTERALIPYFYLNAYPYPHAGSYKKQERKDTEPEVKEFVESAIVEDFNSAAIQHWYYHSPAYPYLSATKYSNVKKTEQKPRKKSIQDLVDELLDN